MYTSTDDAEIADLSIEFQFQPTAEEYKHEMPDVKTLHYRAPEMLLGMKNLLDSSRHAEFWVHSRRVVPGTPTVYRGTSSTLPHGAATLHF